MMTTRSHRLAVVVAVLALGSALLVGTSEGPVFAGPNLARPRPNVLSLAKFLPNQGHRAVAPNSADEPDAAGIAKALGVSTAMGGQWEAIQDAMASYNEQLTAVAGDRMVGLFVPKGATSYSTHIRLTAAGGPDQQVEEIAARAADDAGAPVVVEYTDAPSLANMLAAVDQFAPSIEDADHGIGDVWVDVATSEVAIEVTDGVGDPKTAQAKAAATFGAAGIPFRVDITDQDAHVVPFLSGGASLVHSDGTLWCTAGFPVISIIYPSVTGVSTAAHCNDGLYYTSPTQSTPLQMDTHNYTFDQTRDIEWERRIGSGSTAYKLFWYDGGASDYRTLVGQHSRASLAVNGMYCAFGRRTHAQVCGHLLSSTDTGAACPGGTGPSHCTATWLKVGGTSTMHCNHGDSGGPLYSGGYAIGTLNGGTLDVPSYTCYYMSTDYVGDANVLLYY